MMNLKTKLKLLISCILLNVHISTYCTMKTSLIVPCHGPHAQFLYDMLKNYENQTILPDEVIISLSSCQTVNPKIFKKLTDKAWVFPITLLLSKKRLFAGQNRNIACSHAQGDIFICQDADDLARPQRIEIIKYFFETYNLDFLIHSNTVSNQNKNNAEKIVPFYENFEKIYYLTEKNLNVIPLNQMTNGCPALAKKVFDTIKWPDNRRAEDVIFNDQVYRTFKNIRIIDADLYLYRYFLSSKKIGNCIHLNKKKNNQKSFDKIWNEPKNSESSNHTHTYKITIKKLFQDKKTISRKRS